MVRRFRPDLSRASPMTNAPHIGQTIATPCACGENDAARGAISLRRRTFMRGGAVSMLTGAGLLIAPSFAAAKSSLEPGVALGRLMAGNARFVSGHMQSFDEDLHVLRETNVPHQEPFAAILSCADSRVPVELVFDQSIGSLFVARVAGNIAASDMIASIEYGAAVLGVNVIMVLGHEGCGAVKAAVGGKAVPGQISELYASLRPAVVLGGGDLEATGKANARIQADLLATASPVIAELIAAGTLKVVAAYYTLATGKVSLLD